ncbi:11383_t:CDS:2 [Dentiscutata erythropus]|uniref:11383_t:CDS:1 n=1 Tax=Dentiscutata erythropus TaxID=1348616 RepID=A0A9N9CNC7_9GLOM|nr:11383_t:CDS:2 [Dentiscutata erythropus]
MELRLRIVMPLAKLSMELRLRMSLELCFHIVGENKEHNEPIKE